MSTTPSYVLSGGGTLLTITGSYADIIYIRDIKMRTLDGHIEKEADITGPLPGDGYLECKAPDFSDISLNITVDVIGIGRYGLGPYSFGQLTYGDIFPTSGSEGTPITILGNNFYNPLTVTIGEINASYTLYSSTKLIAIAPAGTNGSSVAILISRQSGPSPTSPVTQFTYMLPLITSITPLTGIYTGGTPITIEGTNFSEPVIVTIGGNKALNVILTGTTITAVTPRTFNNNLLADIVVNGVTYFQPFTYVLTYIVSIGQYITNDTTVTLSSTLIGPVIGGTYIVIRGKNFLSPTVTVGGNQATNIGGIGPDPSGKYEQFKVAIPPGISSDTFADIVVNGILYSKQYNYVTPTITSINPYEGPTTGGTQIVITGTNFTYPPDLYSDIIDKIVFVSSTTVIAITKPLSGNPTLPYTPTITLYGVDTNLFTYYDTSYNISPNVIIVGDTTPFTITGNNAGLSAINFGNIPIPSANYLPIISGTTTIIPPPGFISTIRIYFIFNGISTYVGTVTYINTILADIIPPVGPLSGKDISIFSYYNTSYFDPFPPFNIKFPSSATKIKIGLNYATNFLLECYSRYCVICCTLPPGIASSLPLLLQDASSNTLATSDILFRYVGPPTITSFTPANGLSVGGTTVVITGTEFVGYWKITLVTVTVDGYPVRSLSVDSDTQLTITLPPQQPNATSTPPIVITAVGGTVTSAPQSFRYVNPRVTGISPNSGPSTGGTPITITGTNFSGPVNVFLGTNNATSIVVVNSTTITAIVPPGTGIVSVTVGNVTVSRLYTYIPPSITNIYPSSGSTEGGIPIIITGIYFTDAQNIYINGISTTFTVVSDTEITAITPAYNLSYNQPVPVPLVIEFQNITISGVYTYDDTLLITSVFPTGGVTDGGTPIRINGIGFISSSTVTIGGNPLGNIVVDPLGTFITGTTPPGSVGRQELIVHSNSRSASSFFNYLYLLPQPPYNERTCPGPPYNATNFTSGPIYSTLQSYARNSPNYPWDTGVNAQEIYRSQQNTIVLTSLNQQTIDVKNTNNRLITLGSAGNVPYPQFKSQAERLSYVQGLTLNASRNKITGQNPSAPMGVPCSTIYEIIYS